jgi:hypothetical protein
VKVRKYDRLRSKLLEAEKPYPVIHFMYVNLDQIRHENVLYAIYEVQL